MTTLQLNSSRWFCLFQVIGIFKDVNIERSEQWFYNLPASKNLTLENYSSLYKKGGCETLQKMKKRKKEKRKKKKSNFVVE